jgi:hypothetical protein
MKAKLCNASLLVVATLVCGCRTYDYRLVQPAQDAQRIANRPIAVKYAPLEYGLWRHHSRLAMRIANPTNDRIVLQGNRSYVVAPNGESHPVRGVALGPHSFTVMLLPPRPMSVEVVGGYGPRWGWGWGPGYYPYYDDWFYGPSVTWYQMNTAYDWKWHTGPASLRLSYEQEGKTFDQNIELIREPGK